MRSPSPTARTSAPPDVSVPVTLTALSPTFKSAAGSVTVFDATVSSFVVPASLPFTFTVIDPTAAGPAFTAARYSSFVPYLVRTVPFWSNSPRSYVS